MKRRQAKIQGKKQPPFAKTVPVAEDDGYSSSGSTQSDTGSDISNDSHEGAEGYKVGGYHPVSVRLKLGSARAAPMTTCFVQLQQQHTKRF